MNRRILVISIISIILLAVTIFSIVKFSNRNTASPDEEDASLVTPSVVSEGSSLDQYFQYKEDVSGSSNLDSKKNKEKKCQINGVTVKEGTVISGETCVSY